ncbi:glycosyltransferase [Georgenia yuyongxinii]
MLVPPGLTRPVVRAAVAAIVARRVRTEVRRSGREARVVVAAGPEVRFPRRVGGQRVLLLTDDWVAGAGLMGLSRARVLKVLAANGSVADAVAAVTPELAEASRPLTGHRDIAVLPNGVWTPTDGLADPTREAAGLVGQLNERLDLDALEAVARSGVDIVVAGPRRDRDPAFGARLSMLLAQPNVQWLGEIPSDQVPALLETVSVGLTPYRDTAFNRASFPLKTLEYLAAGRPVVATDLPATRWLGTDLVEVARDAEDFARRVRRLLERDDPPAERARRKSFAGQHTWRARADTLLGIVGSSATAENLN